MSNRPALSWFWVGAGILLPIAISSVLVEEGNYLRVHMAHLRRKLEPNPSQPRYFITEAGMGYRLEPRAR